MKFFNSHEYICHKINGQEVVLPYDENQDHEIWTTHAKRKLQELLGLPFESCQDDFQITGDVEEEDYRKISFEFQSEEEYYIPCDLLIPLNVKKPVPVVICLQGHSSGKHISMGIEKFPGDMDTIVHSDFAIQALKEGYAAVVFDQRYMGETGQDINGTPSCFAENRSMPTTLLGRTAIGERVWDVKRVIDVIETHFSSYIDVKKIICLGNSGGGTATFYSACLDERIAIAIPSCAICTFEESLLPVYHCDCNYIQGIRKYFNMGDMGCLIAPRNLIQVNGIHDPLFRIGGARECHETIKKAYKKLGAIANCYMVEGDGAHQFFPEDVWSLVRKIVISK